MKDFYDYIVYEDGRIYSKRLKRFMKPWRGKTSLYKCIDLAINKKREKFLIHRLVAILYVDNPNPKEFVVVDHIDGDIDNNHYTKLEWITQKENIHRAYETSGIDAVRNFKNCDLYYNDNFMGSFKSISEASRYASKNFGASRTGLMKYHESKGARIIKRCNDYPVGE